MGDSLVYLMDGAWLKNRDNSLVSDRIEPRKNHVVNDIYTFHTSLILNLAFNAEGNFLRKCRESTLENE